MPKITFIEKSGTALEVDAPLGLSVIEIARKNGVAIEGACGGCLACSTCHVIVHPDWYEKLNEIKENEKDMLDIAFDIQKTSRLSCQILMTKELDGLIVALPSAKTPWEDNPD
ncbi:MAG: 2Fe-2S iron-sulfur cluster binding domain-containing protein [Alphaproteobacteria bacterium]|nr:2Fe-2S iron-sulfur cluster binding domain-containing protein [Alphaproteobacteria bacterium]